MKYIGIFAVLIFILPGCIGPKKYGEYVTKYACEQLDTSHYQNKGVVWVNSAITDNISPEVVRVTQGRSYFIPAIFYWGMMESYNCQLNQLLPVNILRKTCDEMIDPVFFSGKFKDDSLEITVNSLPAKFRYVNKGQSIVLIFAVVHLYIQSMIPSIDDLSISYKLHKNGVIVKEGNISIKNWDKPLINNIKSRKKITKAYMAKYKDHMQELSKECLRQLRDELNVVK